MRAYQTNRRLRVWRKLTGIATAAALAFSVLGGTVQAANSRIFSVTFGTPTPVSQGGVTKFDVTVASGDNQTIANVQLSLPASGRTWPAGVTITAVFGPNASMCAPSNGTSLSCDFGNIAAFGTRKISVLVSVARSPLITTPIIFSASAETNNENGANQQVERGESSPLTVLPFSENGVTTFNLGGPVSTSELGTFDAGNLKTTLNLIQDNGGNGNAVVIAEDTNSVQPAYCVALKLTCQPDFVNLTVNANAAVSPYLETILSANVPKTYNIRKAFVIHLKTDGTIDTGFPLFNVPATSCSADPMPLPCATFSLSKTNVLTIVVHTTGNGKFGY